MSGQSARENVRLVKQYTRSAQLMARMAATQGIDLRQGVARDEIHVGTLVCAVTRCAECGGEEQCALWLAGQAGRKPAGTPAYCRNSELLARLRPDADKEGERG